MLKSSKFLTLEQANKALLYKTHEIDFNMK